MLRVDLDEFLIGFLDIFHRLGDGASQQVEFLDVRVGFHELFPELIMSFDTLLEADLELSVVFLEFNHLPYIDKDLSLLLLLLHQLFELVQRFKAIEFLLERGVELLEMLQGVVAFELVFELVNIDVRDDDLQFRALGKLGKREFQEGNKEPVP